jgi:hypothetical protein
VKLDVESGQLLRDWLALSLVDGQDRLVPAAKAKCEGARALLLDLFLLADFREGREGTVTGWSVRRLAAELDLSRNTFGDYMEVLVSVGLVEQVGAATNADTMSDAGWRIPLDVYTWLREGEPLPDVMWCLPFLIGLLSDDPALMRTALEVGDACSTAEPALRSEQVPAAQPLNHAGSTAEPAVAQPLNHAGSTAEPPDVVSPAETAPSDIQTSTDTQTAEVVARMSTVMAEPVISGDQQVTDRVAVLLEGWHPDDLVESVRSAFARQQLRDPVQEPVRWLTAVLGKMPPESEKTQQRIRQAADRADEVAEQRANDCGHGHPHGEFRRRTGLSPCPMCNAERRTG